MLQRSRTFIIISALIAVVVAVGLLLTLIPTKAKDMAQAREAVMGLGNYQKSISLQSNQETVKRDIQNVYAPFVTKNLLELWHKFPWQAPGRLTSSPWPDHIEISGVAPQGKGYAISGSVVLMTSTGNAGSIPFVAQVIKEDGTWKIAAYQEAKVSVSRK